MISVMQIFLILSGILSIFTVLCIVRIFLSWIPNAQMSNFGRFLAKICDPYLDIFKKIKFLRIGVLDISPILAFSVLWALSFVLSALAGGQGFSIALIVKVFISLIWQVISNVIWILVIFLAIRLIVQLFSKSTYGTIWDSVDRSITPFLFKMASPFYRNRPISFTSALVICAVELVLLQFIGGYAISRLLLLVQYIPF